MPASMQVPITVYAAVHRRLHSGSTRAQARSSRRRGSRGYVSEMERGLVVPNVRVIERVAKALEVTMADLVLGESPRERLFALTRGLDRRT